ncbi:hypothetical protein N9J94_05950 [Planktomarina sp.]|nr:hypothetical protein [Planktomarina sp.]MDA9100786.1 hypothetical protein [Planktomarina sp.]
MKTLKLPDFILRLHLVGVFSAFFPFLIPEYIFVGILVLAILTSTSYIMFKGNIKRSFLLISFVLLTLFLLLPSLYISEEEYVFLPYAFFLLPFIYWILLYFALGTVGLNNYEKVFKAAIICGLGTIFVQLFVSPDVFGLLVNNAFAELVGTTTFRPVGLLGSPQNISLLLSLALFLRYSEKKHINAAVKVGIIFCGAATLSTFFGVSLVLFLLALMPRGIAVISIVAAFVSIGFILQLNFENTPFEFLSFSEISITSLEARFPGWGERGASIGQFFFGYGPGTATQGMIDRLYVSENIYDAESYILVAAHEFGWVFVLTSSIIFFCALLFRLSSKRFTEPFYGFYGLVVISLLSLLVTPNFSSLRIKIIFIPILLYFFLKKDSAEVPTISKTLKGNNL